MIVRIGRGQPFAIGGTATINPAIMQLVTMVPMGSISFLFDGWLILDCHPIEPLAPKQQLFILVVNGLKYERQQIHIRH
jgi:hypothetical protein